jgi:CO/xanthine dehydrogenase FAD-binding subunit
MTMATYLNATTVEQAVAALAAGARPVAGGTDLVVAARQAKTPLPESLVGIHRIPELHQALGSDSGLRLGALVTHGSIVAHPEVRNRYTGLADASAIVGSHATRANGTIGGNVMNASPAMDTGAPLLCMGATAVLQGPASTRSVTLDRLWTGPGTTSASPDELLVAIDLPTPPPGTGSAYVRLQYRRQMEIAVVGAAAVVTVSGGVITDARVAIAALAPVIHRVPEAEAALIGTPIDGDGAVDEAARAAAASSRPISDVRAAADYRRAMAEVITGRAVRAAITRATGGQIPIPASESTFGSRP